MRLIQETETGIRVSDGAGWREPYPGEFLDTGDGNFLALNGERAAVAWWKGMAVGALAAAGGIAIVLGYVVRT